MFSTNNITTQVLTAICLFLVMSGCKKYLDKKQNSKLVVPSTLFDLQALLDNDGTMCDARSPSFGEMSSDDYFVLNSYYNSQKESYQSWYIWHNYFGSNNAANDWASNYTPVYYANLVLDQIEKIPQTPGNWEVWNNVKGSALFYRSYYFLQLLWNYAKAFDSSTAKHDPGIALRMTSDFNIPSVRASVQQSYQQIINDTRKSILLLPTNPKMSTRPSKCAAYGLMARCFLSMRDYKKALSYADSSLQLNNYLMDYNSDRNIHSDLINPFEEFNKETIFYGQMNNNYKLIRTTIGNSRIDTSLYRSYEDNDLRKQLFFKNYGDGYYIFEGTYTGRQNFYFSGIATDEMYLIRAEGFMRTGDVQRGLNDLNTLLSKRYIDGTFDSLSVDSEAEAISLVLKERRKELLMRGLRWMDIKRQNKEGAGILLKRIVNGQVYTLAPNDKYYALPIPEDIIELTGMPQNEY